MLFFKNAFNTRNRLAGVCLAAERRKTEIALSVIAEARTLFVASAGATVAVSVSYAPSLRVSVFLFSVTPVTATTDEPEEVQ